MDKYRTRKYSKPELYKFSNTKVCENPKEAKYSRQNFQWVGALSLLHAMDGVNSTEVMQVEVQLASEGERLPAVWVGAWGALAALEVSTGVWFLRWGAEFRDLELLET